MVMADLITIATYVSPLEAHLAKGRLEAEGIPAFIAHEHHIWANWMLSNALGGVKVQINSSDTESAQQIIKTHNAGGYQADLDETQDTNTNPCPACGSNNITSRRSKLAVFLVFISLGLLGVVFNIRKNHHQCNDCSQTWQY